MERITVRSIEEITGAIARANAQGQALEVLGHGTRSSLGAPVNATHALDLSELSGVEMYEPEELVFTAGAGTPLAEVEAMLAENGQMLAFEPPDFRAVLKAFAGADIGEDDRGTLGGMVATGFSGPRQVRHWALRDHLLGFAGVNGRAEVFKSGGRVVKNVTGYDLSKLMAGSFGTLAVLTRLTLRALPAPEQTITLACAGLDTKAAVAAMTSALLVPVEVSGAAHLPDGRTVLRLEGFTGAARPRAELLREKLKIYGDWQLLDDAESLPLWAGVRDAAPLAEGAVPGLWLWRLALAPARGAELAGAVRARWPQARLMLDRAGALIWLALPAPAVEDAPVAALDIRATAMAYGAQAMLFAAPEALRRAVPPFPPLPGALAGLSARVRAGFDPKGVLNPGRMPITTLDETLSTQ